MPGRAALRDLWDARPGYLNTASYGLPPRPAWDALQAALDEWRLGATTWEPWADRVGVARATFGRLVNADPANILACGAVSEVAGLVAAALPDGAEVLVPVGEFTSIVFPWAVHADGGVTVREVPLAEVAESIGERTALVAISSVQSSDGAIADLAAVAAAARRAGALTLVDATQSAGWLPLDSREFDVVACSAYKWLMSPRGTAFGVLSPALVERLRPLNAGWFAGEDVHTSYYGLPPRLAHSARRFDISPAWHCWVGTAAALQVIEDIGVAAIHEHDTALAGRFRAGLGLPPGAGAIVSVGAQGAEDKLARAGIRAAVRDGALRVSFHAYNTDEDVDRALEALTGS
jgi:selenocysteine lyase/cysteine desulfurase